MYFYHESYHDAYSADDLRSADLGSADRSYEPIRIPAILNWLVVVTIALCIIVAAIQALSGSAI